MSSVVDNFAYKDTIFLQTTIILWLFCANNGKISPKRVEFSLFLKHLNNKMRMNCSWCNWCNRAFF